MVNWSLWKYYCKMKQFEMTAGIEIPTFSNLLQPTVAKKKMCCCSVYYCFSMTAALSDSY